MCGVVLCSVMQCYAACVMCLWCVLYIHDVCAEDSEEVGWIESIKRGSTLHIHCSTTILPPFPSSPPTTSNTTHPRTGWNLLQDLIQSRTKKLTGAYEIHKFNRDAREILAKIKVSYNIHY